MLMRADSASDFMTGRSQVTKMVAAGTRIVRPTQTRIPHPSLKSNDLGICPLPAATPRQASSQVGPPTRSEEQHFTCSLSEANHWASLVPSVPPHEVGGAALHVPLTSG